MSEQRLTPKQVTSLTGAVDLAAGNGYSLALKADGTVWAFGWNYYGEQLSESPDPATWVPRQIPELSGVSALGSTRLVLKSDGSVWAWGDGRSQPLSTPAQVPGLTGVVAAEGGRVVKGDGTVWGWGGNYAGQLGDGTSTDRTAPTQAVGLTGVIAVSGSESHTLALKSDGSVWAWGSNTTGQLGIGQPDRLLSPVLFQ